MNKIKNNPYQTNKGGRILCPKGAPKDEPKSKRSRAATFEAREAKI